MKTNPFFLKLTLIFLLATGTIRFGTGQQVKNRNQYSEGFIFPLQERHVHSSSLIELPGGDILCCWFEGSGERSANDVQIMGARLKKGTNQWSTPFSMADTPGQPDCNPVLFMNSDGHLFLFWIVVQANRWERSVIKYRVSGNYQGDGAPLWDWQDVLLLKPDNEFAEAVRNGFRKLETHALAWAEYAPPYERMLSEAAKDPVKRETGWMTRTHPLILSGGKILLPLYSDGYNFSLIAISDDNGKTWQPSLPIVGRGNVQPSLVQKSDGTVIALMRDNGDEPGRIMISTSADKGYSWTPPRKTTLPNPGSSIEALVLKSGNWILVYNDTENGRNSLAISLSEDDGATWKYTRHAEKVNPGNGSFSYPSIIQTKDGHIHITYSYDTGRKETIKHIAFKEKWITNRK